MTRSKGPGTVVVMAAVAALMVAPELASAQQSNAPPPAQVGNRVDHKELQPNPAAICDSSAKETVDCSPQAGKALEKIDRELDAPQPAHPGADSATAPPSGTR
jgi:hypothetical protein